MQRLKVKNDFIFQKIFGQNENKEILISFLNAVLDLTGPQQLNDLEILDNKLKKDGPFDKQGIYRRFTGGGVGDDHERRTCNRESGRNIGTIRQPR